MQMQKRLQRANRGERSDEGNTLHAKILRRMSAGESRKDSAVGGSRDDAEKHKRKKRKIFAATFDGRPPYSVSMDYSEGSTTP
jgi:hypothetical protein